MKVSELIEQLQNALSQYGDIEVLVDYEGIDEIVKFRYCNTGEMCLNIASTEPWRVFLMTFEEVLPFLKQGKRIRRADWTKGYHMAIINGIVTEFDPTEDGYCYSDLNTDDLLAEDWEVCE